MTIELMGKKPTTKRGEKFGRNIHGWGELARYSTIVAPDICGPIRYWLDDSIHEGLNTAGPVAPADALQTEFDAGPTAAYAALVHSADTPKYGPDVLFEPPPGSPHPFVENVAAFLRESGGFVSPRASVEMMLGRSRPTFLQFLSRRPWRCRPSGPCRW